MGNSCPCFEKIFKYFNLENFYYESDQDEEKLNKMKPKIKKEKDKESFDEVWVLIQPGY